MSGSLVKTLSLTLLSGVSIFYRTAGSPSSPTLLLLHGFPSSSFQYRNLIPQLALTHHVIAPDFPGFGFTDVPDTPAYNYTFAGLAATTIEFLDALGIERFGVYVFDYGAPVAFRVALERPRAVTAIVSQNGNAYLEGLGKFWDPIRRFWEEDTPNNRIALEKGLFTLATTRFQYEHGVEDEELLKQIPPETYTLDYALLRREGQNEIQLGLFKDYKTNVDLYPQFQKYLRDSKVPVLVIWGKNDPIFIAPGAEAFKRDVKDLEFVLLDTGHFALETFGKVIADKILAFLKKRGL